MKSLDSQKCSPFIAVNPRKKEDNISNQATMFLNEGCIKLNCY